MTHVIHNRTWLERFNDRINSQNEIIIFAVSIDPNENVSINTINDFPKDKLAQYLKALAEAINEEPKIILDINKKGLLNG